MLGYGLPNILFFITTVNFLLYLSDKFSFGQIEYGIQQMRRGRFLSWHELLWRGGNSANTVQHITYFIVMADPAAQSYNCCFY